MPKFPALKVTQPIGEFFVASLPAHLLLKVTAPDPLRAAVDTEYKGDEEGFRTAIKLLGTQRELEKARLRKISEYIDTVDSTFPNSIILAAKSRADSGRRGWRLESSDDGTAVLDISDDAAPAAVVDGQHRLYSFLHSQLEVRKKFQLVCAVFFDLPSPMQAMLFATINTNQKPVRRGMALNLYGYNIEDEPRDEWSPEKLAVFMTRRLNFDKERHYIVVSALKPKERRRPCCFRAQPVWFLSRPWWMAYWD